MAEYHDQEWTSEQLDAFENLKTGDATKLLKLLLDGEKLCTEFEEHIRVSLCDKGYQVKFEPKLTKKGRRPSRSHNFFEELEFLHMKECLMEKYQLNAGDSEHLISSKMGSNFDYVTKKIRSAKFLLASLKKNGNEYIPPSHDEVVEKYPQLFNDL